jgi:hypothetical protein
MNVKKEKTKKYIYNSYILRTKYILIIEINGVKKKSTLSARLLHRAIDLTIGKVLKVICAV